MESNCKSTCDFLSLSPVSLTIVNINCSFRAAESKPPAVRVKDRDASDFTSFSYSDDGTEGHGVVITGAVLSIVHQP